MERATSVMASKYLDANLVPTDLPSLDMRNATAGVQIHLSSKSGMKNGRRLARIAESGISLTGNGSGISSPNGVLNRIVFIVKRPPVCPDGYI